MLFNDCSYFFNICRLIFDENGALKLSRPGDDVQNVQPQQLFFWILFSFLTSLIPRGGQDESIDIYDPMLLGKIGGEIILKNSKNFF